MSDIFPHSRDDLDFLPCDCELPPPVLRISPARETEAPAVANVGHLNSTVATSPYLNRPLRSLIAAVRDVSAVRDMPVWTFDLLRPARDNVVSLAARRVRRAAQ
jgi:hypothetical protein